MKTCTMRRGQSCKEAIRAAGVKMHDRVVPRNKEAANLGDWVYAGLSTIDALTEYLASDVTTRVMDANSGDGVVAVLDNEDKPPEDFSFTVGKSVCAITIGNLELGHIINGFIGDLIEKSPFDYCFQKHKLINMWIKVGFLQMSYNAINDPKVIFELGEGGVPTNITTVLSCWSRTTRQQECC